MVAIISSGIEADMGLGWPGGAWINRYTATPPHPRIVIDPLSSLVMCGWV